MIGVGTQDTLKQAEAFRARHKITATTMVWDMTGMTWRLLGIPAQPAWALIAPDGSLIQAALGSIPYDKVLAAI